MLKDYHLNYADLSAKTSLANREDFIEEVGALEELLTRSQGHIKIFSPKGHPEITGAGIEFDWGISNKCFRRDNDHGARHYERDVK